MPPRIAAAPPSAADFAGWDCGRLRDEAGRAERLAVRTAYPFSSATADAIVGLGDPLMLFWSALLAMRQDGFEAPEVWRLKARVDALQQAAVVAGCGAPGAATDPAGPGDRTTAAPPAPRFWYEERGGPAGRGATTRWHVRLRPGAADGSGPALLVADGGAAPTPWRLEPDGRLGDGSGGAGAWPQRLVAPLALGQLTAGEFVVPDDPTTRARLRGQVMAFGVQRVGAERFDAALIELFGDAPSGDAYTRVDGVMVVDRRNGLLLRLDLRSANTAFNLRRRLLAVEMPEATPAR